jgi:nucleotide-binding universal stress UspA family protein
METRQAVTVSFLTLTLAQFWHGDDSTPRQKANNNRKVNHWSNKEKGEMTMLPVKKILCPTDFSEPSYEALAAANELALHFAAELYVVHVVGLVPVASPAPVDFNVPLYQGELEASARKMLQEVIEQKVSNELKVHSIVVLGEAADNIVAITEEEDIDLIVIATHGRTGWRRLIFGSVAEKVIRLAPRPVLTIRAPREED